MKENPLEGLLLLHSAWCDYDVVTHLANWYKVVCKLLFLLQLVLGWVAITIGAFSVNTDNHIFEEDDQGQLRQSVFAISITLSFIIGVDRILSPKTRWRKLRSSASSLQSIIWCYRTRVGNFEIGETNAPNSRPEADLFAYNIITIIIMNIIINNYHC